MNQVEFRHIGLVVKDLNKQLFFYKDLLGLEIYYDQIEKGEFIESLLDKKDIEPKIYKLGKHGKIIIELIDFHKQSSDQSGDKSLFQKGITHFSLTVEGIQTLYKTLSDNNIKFINPPKLTPDNKYMVCFCSDFENNYIELVEIQK